MNKEYQLSNAQPHNYGATLAKAGIVGATGYLAGCAGSEIEGTAGSETQDAIVESQNDMPSLIRNYDAHADRIHKFDRTVEQIAKDVLEKDGEITLDQMDELARIQRYNHTIDEHKEDFPNAPIFTGNNGRQIENIRNSYRNAVDAAVNGFAEAYVTGELCLGVVDADGNEQSLGETRGDRAILENIRAYSHEDPDETESASLQGLARILFGEDAASMGDWYKHARIVQQDHNGFRPLNINETLNSDYDPSATGATWWVIPGWARDSPTEPRDAEGLMRAHQLNYTVESDNAMRTWALGSRGQLSVPWEQFLDEDMDNGHVRAAYVQAHLIEPENGDDYTLPAWSLDQLRTAYSADADGEDGADGGADAGAAEGADAASGAPADDEGAEGHDE